MKTLDINSVKKRLAVLIRELGQEPIVLTDDGTPVAVLLPVENADLETISLSLNPKFLEIIERSRESYWREGGLSSEEVRRRFGLEAPKDEKPTNSRRKRKTR